MVSTQDIFRKTKTKYKLVPPDGGWGYLITLSVTVMNLVSIVPQTAFGLIFGEFLASIGDETTGTTLLSGVFNTVQSFTGLLASFLLQKYSYKIVGIVGAILFSIGAFAIIFITDLVQMLLAFGILEGIGFGLMTPASFSAFNCYFDKKRNLMMSVSQTIMVLAAIIFPPAVAVLKQFCGYRATTAILASLSLLNFLAMGVLDPVEKHMKKVSLKNAENNKNEERIICVKSKSLNEEVLRAQIKPLLSRTLEERHLNCNLIMSSSSENIKIKPALKPRYSIAIIGDRAASLAVINNGRPGQDIQKISSSKCIDMSLLKDFKYLNISIGASLSFTSDVAFISIMPLILNNIGFCTTDIALLMMVYFGSDLVSRILISVVSALCNIRNRYVFLLGSFCSAIFRIVFVINDTIVWKIGTLAILGFLRCFIQTPLTLLFSEEYNDNFPVAFSLYMVVCGFVSIVISLLMGAVKSFTQSDIMVVHVLTGAFLISSVSWLAELVWIKMKARRSNFIIV